MTGGRGAAWALGLRMSEVSGRFVPDSPQVRRVGRATRPTARCRPHLLTRKRRAQGITASWIFCDMIFFRGGPRPW